MSDLDKKLDELAAEVADKCGCYGCYSCSGCHSHAGLERDKEERIRAALAAACEAQREADAALCEARARMWGESNASPAKSRRARASEAESLAAAIRAAGRKG